MMALQARRENENRLFHARAVVVGDFRRNVIILFDLLFVDSQAAQREHIALMQ